MDSTTNLEARRRRRRNQQQRALPQIQALYKELHQRFPQTFFREPEKVAPLKKGTHHELSAVYVDGPYNTRVIRWTLNRYVRRHAYVRALAAGKPRIDLCGHEVGIVTEEEREQARTELKTMSRRRRNPRQTDKAKVPAEGASLIPCASGETDMEAQVETATEAQSGTVTDEQEKRLPTTAQRKTTKKRSGKSGKAEKTEEQTGK